MPADDELTGVERDVLELERGRWKYAGAKDTEIMRRFGWTGTRYFQVLNTLIDRPAALRHDPQLVRRLQRVRDQRRAQRTTGRPAA